MCVAEAHDVPCRLAYSSLLLLIFCIHTGLALGSITVTTTTGGPLPMFGFGIFAAVQPPTLDLALLVPPLPLSIHIRTKKLSMPPTINRPALLRRRFLSAGGSAIPPLWLRAAYGGGRDVFLGGMAKCMVCDKRPWSGRSLVIAIAVG